MNIKIFSWNVNGLRAIERKKALGWIDEYKPNILCLQETKLTSESYLYEFGDKKYSFFSLNNSVKKGFSGTVVYSDEKADDIGFCHDIDQELDGRIIKQYYKNLVLFNVYFPNGKLNETRLAVKIKFYENFFKHCEELRAKGKSIIICGDFNTAHKDIDLKKMKIHSKLGFSEIERACLNKFIEQGYIDTYRHIHGNKKDAYTWWSYRSKAKEKNEGWRIDYIFVSNDLKSSIQDAYILDHIDGSDHCPIGIEINLDNNIKCLLPNVRNKY